MTYRIRIFHSVGIQDAGWCWELREREDHRMLAEGGPYMSQWGAKRAARKAARNHAKGRLPDYTFPYDV